MRMMVCGAIVALWAHGAVSAQASEPASPAPAAPAASAPGSDPNKLICRTDQTTGTRLSKTRRCMTAAQWRDVNQQNRDAVERAQAQASAYRPG